MEARVLVFGIAAASAFAAAFAASVLLAIYMRRRRLAIAAQHGDAGMVGLIAWRLRNGYACFEFPARVLTRIRPVAEAVAEIRLSLGQRGFATTSESVLSVGLALAFALATAVGLATGSVIAGLASAVSLTVAASVLSSGARDKRREASREEVPAALESMAACFGSGLTLLQTFRHVADDMHGPLGETFARSAHVLEMGGSAEDALEELRRGACASELAFVAVALDVQHESGGSMRQVIAAAADSAKGELALRRSLRVQTAQAKLSARVVAVMPVVLVTAFSIVSPDFLLPFFSSAYGYALLVLAIVMQVAGIALVRRALSVEGVS